MEIDNDKLENYILYRLIKILYVLGIFLGVTFAIFWFVSVGFDNGPREIIDEAKSYLICNGREKYFLNDVHLPLEKKDTLSAIDDTLARKFCAYGRDWYQSDKYEIPKSINYILSLYLKSRGDMPLSFLAVLLGKTVIVLFCFYVFLNTTREVLLYLFFGKKFYWGWIKHVRLFS